MGAAAVKRNKAAASPAKPGGAGAAQQPPVVEATTVETLAPEVNPLTPTVDTPEPEVPADAPAPQPVQFPVVVKLRNHGRTSITEPATGAFVGAGGSVAVTVHSAEQLSRMRQNIETILSRPGARQSVTVSGLPAAN